MIKYINGNLLDLADKGYFDVIVHGCNCFNTMGAGIANQIKYKYPEVYILDQETKCGDLTKLGTINYYTYNTLTVVNAYTQFGFRSKNTIPISYEAIDSCMRLIANTFKGKVIGMPKIGSGLGSGDWNKIEAIISNVLYDENVIVVNYKE